jgi:glycosyltransferase involved in cell wall biosynthesis
MPRVSILLPVRDAAATLGPALRSIARQTFRDWELIAVDDGSTDDSRAILEQAAAADPRLRVISCPHRGLVASLQDATAVASAPLLARMDADDLMHRRRLELQVARLERTPQVAVLATRVRDLGRTGEGMRLHVAWQNGLVTHEEIARSLFIDCPIAHPSVLLRRDAFERAGGYRDAGWAEDFDLWHRLRELGARFEKLPQVLLAWRDLPSRLTRTHAIYAAEAFHRAKLHYLLRHPLCGSPVCVWGAGPIGRRWTRDLLQAGIEVPFAVDIDPRKVGRTIASGRVPVVAIEEGLRRRRGLILGAVGSRGAREAIREVLSRAPLVEGEDYLFVA